MIGRLSGLLVEKSAPYVLLEVGGVGYELELPLPTFGQLPLNQEVVVLYTHFVVREDAQLLYGFLERRARDLFRELIRLNGVGPKLALALMSGLEVDQLIRAVHNQDAQAFLQVSGVGKKTAERLLIELKDRFKGWELGAYASALPQTQRAAAVSSVEQEAQGALIALGYKPIEAARAIGAVFAPELSSTELIRRALKSMG